MLIRKRSELKQRLKDKLSEHIIPYGQNEIDEITILAGDIMDIIEEVL